MNKIRSKKGVTLISLVVTIIILLILAGVTIAILMGDHGLVNRAENAKIQTEIASIKEEIQIDILGEQAENKGKISDDVLEAILETYGVLSKEEKLMDKTLTTTKGGYEIKVSDIFNGTTIKDIPKNPTFTTGANAPDISGFNEQNTYYVAWDLNKAKTEYTVNEKKMSENVAPSNWYDYTEGINHYANVKTTGGENDCYWVWIPRFAYKITDGYHSNTAGTIDIKFLQGTTNTPIDGTNIEIKNQIGSGNWNVHPAFWFDKDNDGVEDSGEQLTGIWVAKYEASSSQVNTINLENGILTGDKGSLNGTGGGMDTSLKVRVKPNVTSWRGITVNNIFEVCKTITESNNSLCTKDNKKNIKLDSHMMKNTEWGAVVYLSRSVYGKNSEVWNNPYYTDSTNYSPITGLCSNEADGKDSGMMDITKTCRYNEVGGGNASTTGNVYGVYDMAGGACEYVAGIYKGGVSNDNRSKLWDSSNSKYVDKYTDYENINKYGDAVYEISSSGTILTSGGWDSSRSNFPDSNYPVFLRGGHDGYKDYAGVFAFDCNRGQADAYYSFRPVVLTSQP